MLNINKTFFLKIVNWLISIFCIFFMFIINGCSDSSSPKNNKPSIDAITATPDKLAYGEQSTVTVSATDKDNDNLTFNWTCDNGSFSDGSATNSTIWEAPNETGTCGVTVTVSDGEEEVTASVSIEIIGLFYDGFDTDLDKWSNSYCNSWVSSGEAHITGRTSGYFGTLAHSLDENLSPEYTVNMKLARIDGFSSEQYYGLYLEVNDDGDIIIPAWIFAILPSTSDKNWAVICFVFSYSQLSGSWVYLDDNSYGISSLVHTSANVFNDISLTIQEDKTVIARVGNQSIYQSDEISNIENSFGITVNMDLVEVGARTRYDKEIKIDDVVITTPSGSAPKYVIDRNKGNFRSNINTLAFETLPKDIQKLKTLREVIKDLK